MESSNIAPVFQITEKNNLFIETTESNLKIATDQLHELIHSMMASRTQEQLIYIHHHLSNELRL